MDLICCYATELEMVVAQSSSVALFSPFHCSEVTQYQSHSAISGCIEESSVSDHAKQRTTDHIQRGDT